MAFSSSLWDVRLSAKVKVQRLESRRLGMRAWCIKKPL